MTEIKIDQMVRSSRRSLSLEITPEARLVVRAPKRMREEDIRRFLEKKRGWICAKQKLMRQKCAEARPKAFVTGERFLYLGREYALQVVDAAQDRPLELRDRFYLSAVGTSGGRRAFIAWYREQARAYMSARAAELAGAAGLRYTRLTLSRARTR